MLQLRRLAARHAPPTLLRSAAPLQLRRREPPPHPPPPPHTHLPRSVFQALTSEACSWDMRPASASLLSCSAIMNMACTLPSIRVSFSCAQEGQGGGG
jgi:hypothetical protein